MDPESTADPTLLKQSGMLNTPGLCTLALCLCFNAEKEREAKILLLTPLLPFSVYGSRLHLLLVDDKIARAAALRWKMIQIDKHCPMCSTGKTPTSGNNS